MRDALSLHGCHCMQQLLRHPVTVIVMQDSRALPRNTSPHHHTLEDCPVLRSFSCSCTVVYQCQNTNIDRRTFPVAASHNSCMQGSSTKTLLLTALRGLGCLKGLSLHVTTEWIPSCDVQSEPLPTTRPLGQGELQCGTSTVTLHPCSRVLQNPGSAQGTVWW